MQFRSVLVFIISVLVLLFVGCSSCSSKQRGDDINHLTSFSQYDNIKFPPEYCSIQSYPYFANTDYCQKVKENLKGIDIGEHYDEVCKRLPPATVVHYIYPTIKSSAPPIGFSLWYIFAQKAKQGSVKDKAEVGYVIQFNQNGQVRCIYSLGDDISSLVEKIYRD